MEKEFPTFPDKFNEFNVEPRNIEPFDVSLRLRNTSSFGILFKVKCTSNKHIRLENCAEILGPKEECDVKMTRKDVSADAEDQVFVVYALVGSCWVEQGKRNPFQAWLRVKSQQIPTKSINVEFVKE